MAEIADIIMFRIPICPKCKQVASNLTQVKEDRPGVSVKIYTLPDHIGLARNHGLLTIPALIIKGKPYRGVLSAKEIISALDNPA
jgi:hypothetical protein